MKYLFIFLILAALEADGQDIMSSSLAWSVTQLSDLNTRANQAYTCAFKTNGNQNIIWEQNRGFVSTLTVTKTTGSWADVSKIGKVIYDISIETETGTLTFERTGVDVSITIDLSQSTGRRMNNKFSVSGITKIN